MNWLNPSMPEIEHAKGRDIAFLNAENNAGSGIAIGTLPVKKPGLFLPAPNALHPTNGPPARQPSGAQKYVSPDHMTAT